MGIVRRFFLAASCAAACACAEAGCTEPPSGSTTTLQPPVGVELVVGQLPVAPFVAEQLAAQGRVVVYVGAAWCEPCRHFHDAVESGELDGVLPATRFVEYDVDVHRDALAADGYRSRMLPLFAIPNPDGSASARRIEGSIKGASAVNDNLAPRLRKLLVGGP